MDLYFGCLDLYLGVWVCIWVSALVFWMSGIVPKGCKLLFFEVKVVELMNQKQDATNVTGKVLQPRNFFRVGLSTAACIP